MVKNLWYSAHSMSSSTRDVDSLIVAAHDNLENFVGLYSIGMGRPCFFLSQPADVRAREIMKLQSFSIGWLTAWEDFTQVLESSGFKMRVYKTNKIQCLTDGTIKLKGINFTRNPMIDGIAFSCCINVGNGNWTCDGINNIIMDFPMTRRDMTNLIESLMEFKDLLGSRRAEALGIPR